jgi:hypothetical protein
MRRKFVFGRSAKLFVGQSEKFVAGDGGNFSAANQNQTRIAKFSGPKWPSLTRAGSR